MREFKHSSSEVYTRANKVHEFNLQVTSPLLDRQYSLVRQSPLRVRGPVAVCFEKFFDLRESFLKLFSKQKHTFGRCFSFFYVSGLYVCRANQPLLAARHRIQCYKQTMLGIEMQQVSWLNNTILSVHGARTVNSLRGLRWWDQAAMTAQELTTPSATPFPFVQSFLISAKLKTSSRASNKYQLLLISAQLMGAFLILLKRRHFFF